MEFQKNNIITLVIEDMGIHGEGIGKIYDTTGDAGFTFFVKDAVICLCKANKNYYAISPKNRTKMSLL